MPPDWLAVVAYIALATLSNFLTSYPANWFLVRKGIKEEM